METLGLSDSTPKPEGRLRALFWPRIESDVAADTAAQNAMYAALGIAALTTIGALVRLVPLASLLDAALFVVLALGIRQFSMTASILATVLYAAEFILSILRGMIGSGVVIAVIATGLFIAGIRAAWFMRGHPEWFQPPAFQPTSWTRVWRWTRPIFFVAFALLFGTSAVQLFFLRAFYMPSGSMEPTLQIGDRFFALRPAWMGGVRRGDVVAFRAPYDKKISLVKRVIGVPGDQIHFERGRLFLNGQPVEEPYVSHKNPYPDDFRDEFPSHAPARMLYESGDRMLRDHIRNGDLIVPRGAYFVLGDNRDNSLDSRYFGFVPYGDVLGRPVFIYGAPRPERSGKWIQRYVIDQGTVRTVELVRRGYGLTLSSALTPSTHSAAACFDSGIRPPTADSIVAGVNAANSARDLPSIHSVSADPAAMEAVQPRTL